MLSATTARRLVLSLSILSVGLAAALVVAVRRTPTPGDGLATTLADPEVRAAAVRELVRQSSGVFDTHPDPSVGRLFQPYLVDRQAARPISTNRFGLRERDYEMPKPSSVVRVVLLGDSYVHGSGVTLNDRCGAFLEQFLARRAGDSSFRVECLHVGVPSWNILAEASYLRRQLGVLRPDLVVQVVVPNDLDDVTGVRGFGTAAAHSPQRPDRAGVILSRSHPAKVLGFNRKNYLLHGLDHESRSRYRESAGAIAALAQAVERGGGSYLLVLNWMKHQSLARQYFGEPLRDEQVAAIPFSVFFDARLRMSPRDGHWNREGHRRVALFLYALMQQRNLVPRLALTPWPDASAVLEEWSEEVALEARGHGPVAREHADARDGEPLEEPDGREAGELRLASSIDFRRLNAPAAAQVHGGVYPEGAGPYASIVLRGPAKRVVVEGSFLEDPTLEGATLEVQVEGEPLARLSVRSGQTFRVEEELPASLHGRDYLNVRVLTSDFVYGGQDLRRPISLELHRMAVEK